MLEKIKQYATQLILLAAFAAGWGSHAIFATLYDSAVIKAIEATRELAALSTAKAIAAIEVKNTTIQGRVTERIKTEIVYSECKHTPATVTDINDAIRGGK